MRFLLIGLLFSFSVSSLITGSFCSFKDVPCCLKTISQGTQDSLGNTFGFENNEKCVSNSFCSQCLKNAFPDFQMKPPACTLFGIACCTQYPVVNPIYDKNKYAYGKENGKSCIVPKNCATCKWIASLMIR